jgi:hypothetical protein
MNCAIRKIDSPLQTLGLNAKTFGLLCIPQVGETRIDDPFAIDNAAESARQHV